MIPGALLELPELSLRTLARSLRDGPMQRGISASGVQTIVGLAATGVVDALRVLEGLGFSPPQVGMLLEAVLAERARHTRSESLVELVLTGPEVASIPMQDTAAVIHSLINDAKREILLVGYAVHDGRTIFREVAERMDAVPELAVTLGLDIHRGGDTTVAPLLVERFADTFRRRHWPGKRMPSLYYFPPSLEVDPAQRASLHAKCVVIDRAQALVTSANFTEAAQKRNIELGLLVRHAALATRIADYFDGLQFRGTLMPCSLRET